MKIFWTTLAGAVLVAGAMLLMWPRGPAWTTDSQPALAAFEQCLDAEMKFYLEEAMASCEQALDLDPGFAVARLKVARLGRHLGEGDWQQQVETLRQVPLDGLNSTERFLIRYWLHRLDGEDEAARKVLDDHLASHPDDPYALDLRCEGEWSEQQWDTAEECYRRLLEVDPNWVLAQNRRGYIAMAQGRFEEAEKHFQTYLFVAPDQANPHDSMAELLTLRGRYEEAEQQLREALKLRPDFCASYQHLVDLQLLSRRPDEAQRSVEAAEREGACSEERRSTMACVVAVWDAFSRQQWETAWQAAEPCVERDGSAMILGHEAALRAGFDEEAAGLRRRVAELEKQREESGRHSEYLTAMAEHMAGARDLQAGDPSTAATHFEACDHLLRFWDNGSLAIFKLYNLENLEWALERAGDGAAAAAAAQRIDAVNPAFR